MGVRIFVILFFLNAVAFVVRAEAGESRPFSGQNDPSLNTLQEAMSGDFERDDRDSLTELGSRLLQWRFSDDDDGKRYASDQMQPNHGLALINGGACLNLKWGF